MGLYDSIYLEVKCPHCGKIEIRECQTYDLSCDLGKYHKGDDIGTDQYNWLECITYCNNHEIWASFRIKAKINKGIITGEIEFIDDT